MKINTGVLTLSDKGSKGEREDVSGAIARKILEKENFEICVYEIIPDDKDHIKAKLMEWCDVKKLPLIVTTGGTGLSERDVTPEATGEILEREIPGIGETMRAAGLCHTPYAMLSRGRAGIRGRSLIVNLPGNPKAVSENLNAVLPVLKHAIEKILGDTSDCATLREAR